MKFKGTKGKWHACCKDSKPHFLFTESEVVICGFYQRQDDGTEIPLKEVQANARLIESAPILLDALIQLIDPLTGLVYDSVAHEIGKKAAYQIEEAIRKAL